MQRVEAFEAQAKQKQITEDRFLIRKPGSAADFDSIVYRKISTSSGNLVVRVIQNSKINPL